MRPNPARHLSRRNYNFMIRQKPRPSASVSNFRHKSFSKDMFWPRGPRALVYTRLNELLEPREAGVKREIFIRAQICIMSASGAGRRPRRVLCLLLFMSRSATRAEAAWSACRAPGDTCTFRRHVRRPARSGDQFDAGKRAQCEVLDWVYYASIRSGIRQSTGILRQIMSIQVILNPSTFLRPTILIQYYKPTIVYTTKPTFVNSYMLLYIFTHYIWREGRR